VFAVGSLAVYGIVLGGWSSNSKYSFMGSLRSSAQLISYEIPLGMSVLGVMMVSGSLNLERIVDYQARHGWNVLFQPLAALLFATAVFAESNRLPFDLPEAEQELVGGYHTEYSAMKFALFFLGEYTHMLTTSFLVVVVFFGGWQLPWLATPKTTGVGDIILKVVSIAVKMGLFIVFYMLIRWTIPRFRFDQLMGLAWKVMMPLALINIVGVLVIKQYEPLGELLRFAEWLRGGRPALLLAPVRQYQWLDEYRAWLLLPFSLLVLVGAAALSLRLPREPARSPVVRGHAIGQPTLTADRVRLP
jgi:NADH-quinone oxidoreductase subunit H